MSITTLNTSKETSLISEQNRADWERDGFFVLESVVPAEHLEMLRDLVGESIARIDAEMEAQGVERLGINAKGSRYFVSGYANQATRAGEFIFSDLMADITRATLGDNVYLAYEQYVVKASEKGESFSWHQDSGYVGFPEHKPYLSCWVTLDDVNEENGTVYMLPYDRAGTRDYVPHQQDSNNNDMVGYTGDDPGVPVICPAGSIACFSSTVFHRSGPNNTDKMRRIYLPQYSSEPILRPDGKLHNMAIPFIVNGERVR
ncbi:MAG TPA: phytanoyl-CoA dioxygenase family protein [Abditibacteriaceae bacterium]|jgi:ectoine hydroxylase-related dioxygenase (phytanoyl-CoA dioxygenase family)